MAPWASLGPTHPRRCLLLGSWWLTREIEISNTVIGDIDITVPGQATWNLAVSKTDARALGARRTHTCACRLPEPDPLCPACAMRQQVLFALRWANGDVSNPLFPTLATELPE